MLIISILTWLSTLQLPGVVWWRHLISSKLCMKKRQMKGISNRWVGLQIRVRIGKLISLFLIQNICCGYSKESSEWDVSFVHPKHNCTFSSFSIAAFLPILVSDCHWLFPCADLEGDRWSGPPGKSQVIWVYIEISIWTPSLQKVAHPPPPPPPPLENVGTPLDPLNSNSFLCYKTIGPPL